MTYGELKEMVNKAHPGRKNHFIIGGKQLLKMDSWSDKAFDSLTVEDCDVDSEFFAEEGWYTVKLKEE